VGHLDHGRHGEAGKSLPLGGILLADRQPNFADCWNIASGNITAQSPDTSAHYLTAAPYDTANHPTNNHDPRLRRGRILKLAIALHSRSWQSSVSVAVGVAIGIALGR
jgi:hypothetical protein